MAESTPQPNDPQMSAGGIAAAPPLYLRGAPATTGRLVFADYRQLRDNVVVDGDVGCALSGSGCIQQFKDGP